MNEHCTISVVVSMGELSELDRGGAGPELGDVMESDTGELHVSLLDNVGRAVWIPLACENGLSSLVICLARTCRFLSRSPAPTASASKSPHRKKTVYNEHIKHVLLHLSNSKSPLGRSDRMRLAVQSWKDLQATKPANDQQKREASVAMLKNLCASAFDRQYDNRRHSLDLVETRDDSM
jgi:hypothetical protein